MKIRVQVLQEEITTLRGKITAASDEIISIGKDIRTLRIKGGQDDLITGLEADRTKAEAQQAKLEAQQAEAKAELTGLLTGVLGKPQQYGFPQEITRYLPNMLFAVLDKSGPNEGNPTPVGVAFFVRPHLAITAFHVLNTHYKDDDKKSIVNGLTVHLSREAGLSNDPNAADPSNFFETQLVEYNVDEDWALMKLSKLTENIRPFVIGRTEDAEWADCQLLSFNIALSPYAMAEDTRFPHIIHTRAFHRDRGVRTFIYDCMAHEGDSGGAVVMSVSGEVVAMHCEFVNAMKEEEAVKRSKTVKAVNDLHSEISSGKPQGAKEGIRLDYLQHQGIFHNAY